MKMHENKCKNCIRRGKKAMRAAAMLIALIMVFLSLPVTALVNAANGAGSKCENTFLLTLGTGRASGEHVKYFAVKYRDFDCGAVRTEFIFPSNDVWDNGMWMALQEGDPYSRIEHYSSYTGEEVPKPGKSEKAPLSSNSVDNYLIKPKFRVDKIISIDVYMSTTSLSDPTKTVKAEWTCSDIRLYKVDTLYGLKMYGYCSEALYVEFKGTLIGSLAVENVKAGEEAGRDFSCSGMDLVCRLGVDESAEKQKIYSDMGQLYHIKYKNESYDNTSAKRLLRMDIADVNGGGIEALSVPVSEKLISLSQFLRDSKFREPLALELKYKDIYDRTRVVNIPVVTSFCAWLTEVANNPAQMPVIGVMQQDDTVVFDVNLPDYKELSGYSLAYNDNAETICGIKNTTEAKAEMEALRSCPTAPKQPDFLSITGLSVFGSDASYTVTVNGGRIKCSTEGVPEKYYSANSIKGFTLTYGTNKVEMIGEMRQGREDAVLRPSGTPWTYVVEIETDTISYTDAATTENITAKFHYLSTSGREKTAEVIKLRTAAADFSGYWEGIEVDNDGSRRNLTDTAYRRGTACGGKIIFGLEYTDVDYFTAVTLSMDQDVQDEWQMKSIKIYRVNYVSERYAEWEQVGFTAQSRKLSNGVMTDRHIYRDYDKSACVRSYSKEKVLLYKKENSKKIVFDSGGGGNVEREDVNWEDIKNGMDYETTTKDLGFTKGRCEYEVQVKIKSNLGSTNDDDCGSSNKFYFKLVFQNGSSAYVLANQQLLADGFRAGQTESFRITTNRDYGDLNAVYIIPDDIQDDSTPDDKLNIESMTVINTSDTGVSRTWKCHCAEGGEWIAVKYVQDVGAQGTASGQQGRSETSLANILTVDSAGYSLNFLFTIKTTGYTEGYDQFDGTLMANITYMDSMSIQQQMSIDVIRAMYSYMGKEPQWSKNLADDSSGDFLALANPSLMLRPNHVDRFIVTIPDVKQIIGMEFFGSYSKGDGSIPTEAKLTEWLIGSVEVFIVKESGHLEINNFNEYKRTDVVERLCGSMSPQGYIFQITSASEKNNLPMVFDNGVIEINENGTWKNTTPKEPISNNDTLNLYVYMADTADKKADYTMNASIIYLKREDDNTYQTYAKNMTRSKDGKMFSKIGLSAKSLSTIYQLNLKANSYGNPYATVDKVIVQHVRSGVVINNYVFDFGGRDACFSEISQSPSSTPSTANNDKQVVMLQLSDDTQTTVLEKDVDDVTVSIRYTTTNDSGKETYNSKSLTFSSAGVGTISPNKVVRLEFNEPYVKEITGINLQSTGDVKTSVECACVETLTSDSTNKVTRTGWYNFGGSDGRLSFSTKTLTRTNVSVVPLKLSFIVGNATRSTMPVRMDLKVLNRFSEERTDTYADINKFVISGSFMAGQTVTAEMLVSDVSEMRYITLTPYDNTSTEVSLELASVLAEWTIDGTDASASREIKAVIPENGKQVVNLCDVVVEYSALAYNSSGNSYGETNSHTDGTASSITIKSGEYVIVKPKVKGTLPGYGYTVNSVQVDGDMSIKADYCVKKDGAVIFQPPVNNSGEDIKYRITFKAEEVTSAEAVLIVTVKSETISGSDKT